MSKFRRWIWGLIAVIVLVATALLFPRPQSSRPADHYRMALRAVEDGNNSMLRRELDWFRRTSGTDSYRSLLAGVLLLKDGDAAAALTQLQHATNDEATRVDAWTYAAEAYHRLNHFTETVAVARSALNIDPAAHMARRWLAIAYYDLGAIAPAAEELRILSREIPTDGRPDRLLALIDKDNEQFREAVEHYRETLRRDPRPKDLDEILTELAECQLKMQDHAGCVETLARMPGSAARLVLEAEAQEGLGRHAQARGAVDRALQLEPEHVPTLIYKATLLMTEGQATAAVPVLEQALQLHPHNATARFKLSQAYSQVGEPERAAEQTRLMDESRKLEREFVDLHHKVATDTENADLRFQLGTLARKLHKPDLARMWFRAAVSLDPNHAAATQALAELSAHVNK